MRAEKQGEKTNSLKILIATDKFKGSLTSLEAAQAIRRGIEKYAEDKSLNIRSNNTLVRDDFFLKENINYNVIHFDIVEIADGGDGSASVVKKYCGQRGTGRFAGVDCTAAGPLGERIYTSYIIYGKSAFIEMAKISGLELLPREKRNPLYTTTYGLGEVIKHALGRGADEITLSIGGSATNDGGSGMLQALGVVFSDACGNPVTENYMCGKDLERISAIEIPENILVNCNGEKAVLNVICDVTNPLLGDNGATMVYGTQKGATAAIKQRLETGMENYIRADIIQNGTAAGINRSPAALSAAVPGAGAAGGTGFAAMYFLGGALISGWKYFASLTRLEERIASSDIVISGEGKIDSQSFQGKVIDGISRLAAKYNKPLVLFCGVNEAGADNGFLSGIKIYGLDSLEPDIDRSMADAGRLLSELAGHAACHPPFNLK